MRRFRTAVITVYSTILFLCYFNLFITKTRPICPSHIIGTQIDTNGSQSCFRKYSVARLDILLYN
jgi:hypothetical protein